MFDKGRETKLTRKEAVDLAKTTILDAEQRRIDFSKQDNIEYITEEMLAESKTAIAATEKEDNGIMLESVKWFLIKIGIPFALLIGALIASNIRFNRNLKVEYKKGFSDGYVECLYNEEANIPHKYRKRLDTITTWEEVKWVLILVQKNQRK